MTSGSSQEHRPRDGDGGVAQGADDPVLAGHVVRRRQDVAERGRRTTQRETPSVTA